MELDVFVAALPEDEAQLQALISVVSAWSAKDPQTVASWVEQFPESRLREQAMEQLVTAWTTKDPLAASHWLRDTAATTSRDAGVIAHTHLIAATHPEAAFRWAETIVNELTRDHMLVLTAVSWLRENLATAREAISSSSLPAETKSTLLGQN